MSFDVKDIFEKDTEKIKAESGWGKVNITATIQNGEIVHLKHSAEVDLKEEKEKSSK